MISQVRYGGRHPMMFKLFPEPEDPEERAAIFKKSIRFTVVRHPFARYTPTLINSYSI